MVLMIIDNKPDNLAGKDLAAKILYEAAALHLVTRPVCILCAMYVIL